MAKKYVLASSGNVTVILAGSRQEPITNAMGQVIGKKNIPALKAVFDGGIFETDNEDIITLIKQTQHWGNDVYWHPAAIPADEPEETKKESVATAKKIADSRAAKAERRRKGQQAAIEGNVPKE